MASILARSEPDRGPIELGEKVAPKELPRKIYVRWAARGTQRNLGRYS
jgi:hypothetical protein